MENSWELTIIYLGHIYTDIHVVTDSIPNLWYDKTSKFHQHAYLEYLK